MKRIGLIGLALIATCALSGVTAASSSAAVECQRVRVPGSGVYENSQCAVAAAPKEWVKALAHTKYLGQGIWCVETELNAGNRTDPQCKNNATGKFIEVLQPGPNWHVGGAQLKQGTKQIKLQLKGSAVLKSSLGIEIECKNSLSEGATIEGRGEFQGQDKGRVTYTQCKVLKPEKCKVAEPITTTQLKSYLAFANTQTKIVDVFQPTSGNVFVELTLTECGLLNGTHPVEGAVAAEVIPTGVEGEEGLIAFPSEAISKVSYEGQEPTIELKVSGFSSTFSGAYGARLATNERYGVFEH